MENRIDFVVTWVDDTDDNWIKEKNYWQKQLKINNTTTKNRYKDWGIFKYWFRGVEKFAPWVNNVYLVTNGQIPSWINPNAPKLKIIKHNEYLKKENLPTFNSNAIELSINRIDGLSDKFVLFNDDMYLINKTNPKDFFNNGLPCDTPALNVHCPDERQLIQYIVLNDVGIINKYFNINKVIKSNPCKWFNIKNGNKIFRTLILLNCPRFPGFWQSHLPISYLKSTWNEVWKKESKILEQTSTNKFRTKNDVNHWLFREWNLCTGNFVNRKLNFGKVFNIGSNNYKENCKKLIKYIRKQKGKCVCINDGETTPEEFEDCMVEIKNEFDKILPEKCSFEK